MLRTTAASATIGSSQAELQRNSYLNSGMQSVETRQTNTAITRDNNRSTSLTHRQNLAQQGASGHSGGNYSSNYAVNNIFKAYSSGSDKYTGSFEDNLDHKLAIFEERCEQSGILPDDRRRVFSAMLSGTALQYYLKIIKPTAGTFDEAVFNLRKRFITKERTLSLTREWESTKLSDYLAKYADKPAKDALQLMISRLQEIQGCLPQQFHSDELLMNKLLNACEGVEACRLARQKPADTIEGTIADLHTSIATYRAIRPTSAAMITDRKRRESERVSSVRQKRKFCFVCKKPDCWSTRHSREERMKALRKSKRFRAFLTELDENCDDFEETLEALEEAAIHFVDPEVSDDGTEDDEPSCSITVTEVAKEYCA